MFKLSGQVNRVSIYQKLPSCVSVWVRAQTANKHGKGTVQLNEVLLVLLCNQCQSTAILDFHCVPSICPSLMHTLLSRWGYSLWLIFVKVIKGTRLAMIFRCQVELLNDVEFKKISNPYLI